jgi:hypothetical protein
MRYILVSQSEKKTTKVYHEDEAKKHKQKSITIEPKVRHVPWVQCPFMLEDYTSMEHHLANCFVACQTPRPFIHLQVGEGKRVEVERS